MSFNHWFCCAIFLFAIQCDTHCPLIHTFCFSFLELRMICHKIRLITTINRTKINCLITKRIFSSAPIMESFKFVSWCSPFIQLSLAWTASKVLIKNASKKNEMKFLLQQNIFWFISWRNINSAIVSSYNSDCLFY